MENYALAGMARAEKHLIDTVAEFYRGFYTYRRLAEGMPDAVDGLDDVLTRQ